MGIFFQIFIFILLSFFAIFCIKNIWIGINMIILSVPLYLVRFNLLGIPTTLLEMMIYILFLIWFFREFNNIYKTFKKSYLIDKEKFLWVGIFFMFLGVLLSTFFSKDLRTSLGALKGFFIDPFLLFTVTTYELGRQKEKNKIFFSYIFSAFLVSVIGIFYLVGNDLTFDGRLSAFYESPNYLAMYIAPAFLLLFYQLFFLKKEELILKNKKFNIILILILIFIIFASKSFGAILGISIAIFFLVLKTLIKRSGFKKQRLYMILIFSFVLVMPFSYQKYEQIIYSEGRSSYHSRIMIWRSSTEMIKNSPFFGIGPGTFQEEYLNLQILFDPYLEWAVNQPHNTFLAFYLQSGFIGFIGFMIIVVWLIKKNIKNDMMLIFMIYFLCHSLVDTLYWKNDLAIIFFIILAFVLDEQRKDGSNALTINR